MSSQNTAPPKPLDRTIWTDISVRIGGPDAELFIKVWNQGIDSHLQAFTLSRYVQETAKPFGHRLTFYFHRSELDILLRRLTEIGSDRALTWAQDIEASAGGEL